MHRVAVVAFDGVVPFDLAVPLEVFGRAMLPDGHPAYDVAVCGTLREVDAGHVRVVVQRGLSALRRADTIIVPGVSSLEIPIPQRLLSALRHAHARGARIASVCSGALVLAQTGLLDDRRATTHWRACAELARRHPRIQVDPNVLYVDEGTLLTSAGAASALDLCMYMVRKDYGARVAADVARLSVMPLEREGGQAQFIVAPLPESDDASLGPLLRWLEQNLSRELNLERIAKRAALSVRSLSRHFRSQTGTTPLRWLHAARIRRARLLLETTRRPVESIAESVGFQSQVAFRTQFRRIVGTSPVAYRRTLRADA